MSKIIVCKSKLLQGKLKVQGAKNAVLPLLAATILNRGENVIHDCPQLSDVKASENILRHLGCTVSENGTDLVIDSSSVSTFDVPDDLMREMRSSIIFLGAIVARCKEAYLSMPGGCELGPRPIDIHLKALRSLGIEIEEAGGKIHAVAKDLHPAQIHLDMASVGATENIMLAACNIAGVTTITNAAREPEIEDLQNYINEIGGKISGAGTSMIRIEGVSEFKRGEHTVIPDRIVAATYLIAAMITGGSVELENVVPEHMYAILAVLRDCGASIYIKNKSIVLLSPKVIKPVDIIRTSPYPGFPTDVQSILMSLLSVADGTSILVENIFENRFKYVDELARMGADIKVDGKMAVVKGVKRLTGANTVAMDLRGGAALVVAALCAEGKSEIESIGHIERGYENLAENLRTLGADITRVE